MGAIMTIASSDYEKLGQFYLGREYDAATEKATDDLILYDSKDLVTHGVVLGMTGSGKTGLCLALLEEAALDNIPAIIIDPKGDIANLMLLFPELDAASFRPWINEDDAAKKGITPEEHATKTAALWKSGLAEWGQDPSRISQLRDKVDIHIFTPGSRAGIPVSIFSSLAVPPFEIMDDAELLGERIQSTVSSLLSLIGEDSADLQSPEAVLMGAIFKHAWAEGQDITLETLIRAIQKPAFGKVGIIDLDSFMPEKSRQALALKFNNLLASPGFETWLEGPSLDIAKMLHNPQGKPCISIFSIAHLGDAERMFFVSLLLNQMLGWMRAQKGTTSLRALLYMDEIFGYLPPSANPPSKRPMMTLLKQGRAFGLGCLLATQNPVDLDYKALSNIGTWFLGRLQTERDKMRVMDGLEGAMSSQNGSFDRQEMERLISGLGNRIFLMNNVHENGPVLMQVRWALSYLAGPLSRGQIKTLMDPVRGKFLTLPSVSAASNPMAMPGGPSSHKISSARPIVGAGVTEKFVRTSDEGVIYEPHLLREAIVHFSLAKSGVDSQQKVTFINRIGAAGIDWDHPIVSPKALALEDSPQSGAEFAELPGFAMNAANYKQVKQDFEEWLYRNQRLEILSCPALKMFSEAGESEGGFRTRLHQVARETRDLAVDKLRDGAAKKISTLEARLQAAEDRMAREKTEAGAAKMQAGVSILGGILGAVLGRKVGLGSISRGASSLGKASSAYKQSQDVAQAGEKIERVTEEIAELNSTLAAEVAEISSAFDAAALVFEKEFIKPTKAGIDVQTIALLWVPEGGDL